MIRFDRPRTAGGGTVWSILLALTLSCLAALAAPEARLATDQPQYEPGARALIAGSGFAPREQVRVTAARADGAALHGPWWVKANNRGEIATSWTVCAAECRNAFVVITAVGQTSKQSAQSRVCDGRSAGDNLEGWFNTALDWGGTINGVNSRYGENEVIPTRFTVWVKAGSVHTLTLQYDYSNGGAGRFIDFLTSFDAGERPELLKGFEYLETAPTATAAIPAEAEVPAGVQIPGTLLAYNVTALACTPAAAQNGLKALSVQFQAAPGSGLVPVLIAFGAHTASQAVYGAGNGAASFSGASRKVYASLDGEAAKIMSINPDAVSTDTQPPNLVCPPAITVAAEPGRCDATVTYTVTATDESGIAAVTCDPPSGVFLPVGTTEVQCQATDGAGNVAQCSFTVTVVDAEPPTVVCPDDIQRATDPGQPYATVDFQASATDNCDGPVSIHYRIGTRVILSRHAFPVGATVVTAVATDRSGNSRSCNFTVTVTDEEPPVIACPGSPIRASVGDSECQARVAFAATASDNHAVAVRYFIGGQEIVSPHTFPVGRTNVRAVAADPAGHTAECTFTVEVVDEIPPRITSQDVVLTAPAGECEVPAAFNVQASDNCAVEVQYYLDHGTAAPRTITEGAPLPVGSSRITAIARDPSGNQATSEFFVHILGNVYWPDARTLSLADPDGDGVFEAAAMDCIGQPDQSRWYRFAITPGSRVVVTLTDLPANYDLVLFRDIGAAYLELIANTVPELQRLGAEFAADAFSPAALSPAALSPAALSPAALSSAQIRSVVGISAFEGLTSEGLVANTWLSQGSWYVRVRGRNGEHAPGARFQLRVYYLPGACENVKTEPQVPADAPALTAPAGGYRTLVLTDFSRLPQPESHPALLAKLVAFCARPEVAGVVLDVDADARVAWFNQQADAAYDCPFAKNLVADAIRAVIARSRQANPALENIVLIGNDDVVPFFRHPDQALLGPERDYVPPVRPTTASQASLGLNYVLGQDFYGSACDVPVKASQIPIPDLPVGRLVETPGEAMRVLDAYLNTADGTVPTPASALVSGYDFLEDAARAVLAELNAGIQGQATTLITPGEVAPTDPAAWTADQLRPLLFEQRHDLAFLAGHFSASGLLAADFQTTLYAAELAAAPVNLENAIVFSAGCHSGYNIVDPHAVPGLTREPDWAQAFARKGATLLAGTGYQYGDTDFIEYSERLYLQFARELRKGRGPVSVGEAMVRAKRWYLATTPALRGIHEKAFVQMTLFGLPNLKVNLPGRNTPPGAAPDVDALAAFAANPGAPLGLQFADLTVNPALTEHTVPLTVPDDDPNTPDPVVPATYFTGRDGVLNNPAEPVLPLEVRNVTVAGTALRGVAYRRGTYTDRPDVLPLTGAATTEIRGVHPTFAPRVFYQPQWWAVNHFDAVCAEGAETTRLMVTAAQFASQEPGSSRGILRLHDQNEFRLYYSANTQAYVNHATGLEVRPSLAAPPAISAVRAATVGNAIHVSARVTGDPAAGIQEVWVNHTALTGARHGTWEYLPLEQHPQDSTLWTATLPLPGDGTPSGEVRFIVQAVNGVGLVSVALNGGKYYRPDAVQPNQAATKLEFLSAPAGGAYGGRETFQLLLTASGAPVAGRPVSLTIGDQTLWAYTAGNGEAVLDFNLLGTPGSYPATAVFDGDEEFASSFAVSGFTMAAQPTALRLEPEVGYVQPGADSGVVAWLTGTDGDPLIERTVVLLINGAGGWWEARSEITDFNGRVRLGRAPAAQGQYRVTATFGGVLTLPNGETVVLDDGRYEASTATIGGLVVDATAPQLVLPGQDIVRPGSGSAAVEVSFQVRVTDSSPVTLAVSTPSGSLFTGETSGPGTTTFDVTGSFAPGTTPVAVTATDRAGNTASGAFNVVIDTLPPAVSLSVSPAELRPPNHKLVEVRVTASASDNSGQPVTSGIVAIMSNEPENGTGDGDQFPDYLFTPGAMTAQLRAERAQNGVGRTYTVTVESRDVFGNAIRDVVTVFVPK
jgi:hypothetical protein